MKVYSIFIIFCFIQTLICNIPGVTRPSLENAVVSSLPLIKSFHPEPFSLSGSSLREAKFSFKELRANNVKFKLDEFNLLHLQFVNIKGKLKGTTFNKHTLYSNGKSDIKTSFVIYDSFTAELDNISFEITYAVESTKKAIGKYDIKFKSMNESSISYNIFRFTMSNDSKEQEIETKIQINKLNFTPFKNYLKRISELILRRLQNRLK